MRQAEVPIARRAIALAASLALVIGLFPAPALAAAVEGVEADHVAVEPADAPATEDGPSVPEGTEAPECVASAPAAGEAGDPGADASAPDSHAAEAGAVNTDEAPAQPDVLEEAARCEPDELPAAEANAPESPAFSQSRSVNGVTVTVNAGARVFPEDAVLSVSAIPSSQVEDVIEEERDAEVNVAASYTFDIKILDADGIEIQPAEGQTVSVSFSLEEVTDENLDTQIYHISDDGSAEELDVDTSGETAFVETTGFSLYTVEFTYGDLQYVLPGDSSVAMSEILFNVGLSGEVTAVEVSNADLLSASKETGEWTVTAHRAFSTTEWMRVTIDGVVYEIEVTDDDPTPIDPQPIESYNLTLDANYEGGQGEFISNITSYVLPVYSRGDSNYTFMGWADSPSGSVKYNGNESITLTSDLVLYAVWATPLIGDIPASDGGYVYVGGIRWRVIGVSDSKWLLISANVLDGYKTWNDAKNYCETVYGGFSALERAAVSDTTKTDIAYDIYAATDLNGAKLFLLSASEATFYFSSDADRQPGWWWLRSPDLDGNGAGAVRARGDLSLDYLYGDYVLGARPAFQLNLESVLFSSAAEGGKSSAAAGSGGFGTFKDGSGSDRKLTLIDSSRSSFDASAANTAVAPGGAFAVSYSGANTGTNEYVSAMLCDSNGGVLYYASLTSAGSGTWNMTIPSDLEEGSYTLKVFSEQQNGTNNTDYAGTPVPIALTVSDSAPTTYAVTVNSGSGSGAYVKDAAVEITANEPEAGKQFKEWTGADGLTFTSGNATSSTATFTMPAQAVEVTATYEDAPATTYTVTYKVVNGTWADGSTEDQTESVASGSKPGTIPTGMIPSSGYEGGAWDTEPANVTITEETTFIFTFDAASTPGGKQDIDLSVVVCDEVYGDEIQCIVSASVDGEYELTVAGNETTITVKDHLGYFNAGVMDAGTYQAAISFAGDSNYNRAFATTTFTVYPVGTTFEVSAEPAQVVEGGTIRIVPTLPNGATGTVKYFLGLSDDKLLGEKPVGEGLELPTSGEDALAPGTYAITAEYSGDVNYIPAKEIVLVTIIAKPSLTITALLQTYTYNGQIQGEGDTVYEDPAEIAEKVTVEGLQDGDELTSIIIDGQGTGAGDYDLAASNASIVNAAGDPVTDDYNIEYVPGTLTIEPAKVTITVNSASKAVGEDDPAFTGNVSGLITEGDLGEIRYVRTGGDEAPGTYEGVLTATCTDNPNYKVTVVPGDFTIKALYTHRWLDGDGSLLQEKSYVEGDEPPAYDGKEPSKAATAQYTYGFTGWDEGTVDGAVTTYRPLFSETVNKYQVTFVDWDGTVLQSGEVAYGETPKYEGSEPAREADADNTYEFAGWTPAIAAVTGEATYTATYDATPIPPTPVKATLTFDLGGGTLDGKTGTITIEANVGDTIKLPGAPTREGYTFKFWKGSQYDAGTDYEVEGDHAFIAAWEKDAPAPATKHTVSFDANGHGKAPAAQEVEDGKTASKPSDPKADGWTFGGWYTDKPCTTAYDFTRPVTADMMLYAKWMQEDSPAPAPTPVRPTPSIPQTGDPYGGMLAMATVAALVSGLCLVLAGVGLRRRRGTHER